METDEAAVEARQRTLRRVHDIAMGALGGFAAGFVLGLLALRYVESGTFPFLIGAAGAVFGAWGLYAAERGRPGVTPLRVLAWVLLGGAVLFVGMLLVVLSQTF